ncbi:MAG: AsnC family protein [SAR202 cluster bacterium]|jgi:DNA-binding Lrp family transcriptional regulator|nr:AsnC family protein [SAR202 cluster bacterium]|tara:strand:+ start:1182 stop:1655 length:474 start_codon:yes stop_codon:yes gene_type:complete
MTGSELQVEVQRALQEGLPIVARPYHALAERLGTTEEDVIESIRQLQDDGAIKRFGMVLKHRALGYQANAMVVWDVPDHIVDQIGGLLGEEPCVTLSYRRTRRTPEWNYNLFCMIHGTSREKVQDQLAEIISRKELDFPHQVLFSTHCFKQRGAVYV